MIEPPQDLAAERAVLSVMMRRPEAIDLAAGLLGAADFYRAGHARIFEAILAMRRRDLDVDLVTLVSQLRSTGNIEPAGGPSGVASLLEAPAAASNLASYAAQVRDAAARRDAHRLAERFAAGCLDPAHDLATNISELAGALAEIQAGPPRSMEHLRDGLPEIFLGQDGAIVPWGLECLSALEVTPGRLCTLAARPGKGKTAMLGTITLAAARAGWNVLFFSLEMTGLEIRQRLLSGFSGIPLADVVHRRDPRLPAEASRLADLPIWIRDESTARLDVEAITTAVRNFDQRPALVLIDYLQLVGTRIRFERRYEAIGHVCRELKHMALRLGVPVIAAAQLSRAAEERAGRPQLSDLRESGEIEQTSNQVVLMHRGDDPAQTDLKVAKNRHGPSFTTACYFRGETCTFEDS